MCSGLALQAAASIQPVCALTIGWAGRENKRHRGRGRSHRTTPPPAAAAQARQWHSRLHARACLQRQALPARAQHRAGRRSHNSLAAPASSAANQARFKPPRPRPSTCIRSRRAGCNKTGPGDTGACGCCDTDAGDYALLKTSSPPWASTRMLSPLAYCPERIFWASGFSSWAWIARLSGRAP